MTETVEASRNQLVGTNPERIIATVRDFMPPVEHPPLSGDGHAAEHITDLISNNALEFGRNYDRVAVPVSAQLVAI